MRRPRFRLRTLMVVIAWCALLATAVRVDGVWLVLIILGPVTGALILRGSHRRRALGGAIGGVAVCWSLGAVAYLQDYLSPRPNTVDLLGPPLAFFMLALLGASFGAVFGIVTWGLIHLDQRPR